MSELKGIKSIAIREYQQAKTRAERIRIVKHFRSLTGASAKQTLRTLKSGIREVAA